MAGTDVFRQAPSRRMQTSERSRLPPLRPHLNKKGQAILQSHMYRGSGSSLASAANSTASVPVQTRIDNTVCQASPTHDISYLRDSSTTIAPRLAASLIQDIDWIYESSFLPLGASSVYSEEDGMWHTKVFPSDNPSSRTDAVLLDAWLSRALSEISLPEGADFTRQVSELVPTLSVGLHEIVRQVTHSCPERGRALEKVWHAYVHLFDRVQQEMETNLFAHKEKEAGLKLLLSHTNQNLEELRRTHPAEMQAVLSEKEATFGKQQSEVESELAKEDEANLAVRQELREHHQSLQLWLPWFQQYQGSYIKAHIPSVSSTNLLGTARTPSSKAVGEDGELPEMAIAEDFKRLLMALTPEKRKAIGKELADLLGVGMATRARAAGSTIQEKDAADAKEIELLQEEVRQQEETMELLRSRIEVLEGPSESMSTRVARIRSLESKSSMSGSDSDD